MSTADNKRVVSEFVRRRARAIPDARMEIGVQVADGDLVCTRRTLRGTHSGELWGLAPNGNDIVFEFVDVLRVADGMLIKRWTSMDLGALKNQMHPKRD